MTRIVLSYLAEYRKLGTDDKYLYFRVVRVIIRETRIVRDILQIVSVRRN